MKKLVLFAVVVIAVSFASCKQKAQEPVVPVEETVVEETVVDTTTTPADTIQAVAVEEVK